MRMMLRQTFRLGIFRAFYIYIATECSSLLHICFVFFSPLRVLHFSSLLQLLLLLLSWLSVAFAMFHLYIPAFRCSTRRVGAHIFIGCWLSCVQSDRNITLNLGLKWNGFVMKIGIACLCACRKNQDDNCIFWRQSRSRQSRRAFNFVVFRHVGGTAAETEKGQIT